MDLSVPLLRKVEFSSKSYLERVLPSPGTIRVKVGEIVRPFDIVADSLINLQEQTVNLRTLLKIRKKSLDEYLRKREGEGFKKGEMIAENWGNFGFQRKQLLGPFDGVIQSVNRETGEILLRTNPDKKTVLAGAGGEVVQILDSRAVLLAIVAVQVTGVWAGGQTAEGELLTLSSFDQPLELSKITPAVKGKIIIGGSFVSLEAIKKAIALEALGIITGGVNVLPNDYFSADSFGLLVTEGFGSVPMLESTWQYLRSAQARTAILIPERDILLVPENSPVCPADPRRPDGYFGYIAAGDLVQIFCWPYFGRVGKVAGLEPKKTFPSGVIGEAVKINLLGESEEISIPLRNVGKLV